MPVLNQPGNPRHLRLVQNQHHEHVVGDIPFARNSTSAGRPEPEAWVERRVPDNDDERAARVSEFLVSRFDQHAADTLALVFRKHGHGPKRCPSDVASHEERAVHDVPDHSAIQCRDQ